MKHPWTNKVSRLSQPSPPLADWAKKGGPLGLNDADDLAAAALPARLARPVIYPMMVLIAARLVEGVAVGSVAERRTLAADRQLEHRHDVLVNRLPLASRQPIAALGRMHAGQ